MGLERNLSSFLVLQLMDGKARDQQGKGRMMFDRLPCGIFRRPLRIHSRILLPFLR
jgi:hypothetical protein